MRKYLRIAGASLQSAITYRGNVWTGYCFYVLFLYVFYNLWRAIYSGGRVEGFTFAQMIWYLCMTELISFGTRSNIYRQITDDVKTGQVAYQLNRPYKYVSYQFANALGPNAFNLATYAPLAIAVGLVLVGPIPGYDLRTLPLAVLSMVLGMQLNFFFMMALGLSAFRIEENFGVYLIYQKLVFMMGTFIPVEFLPGWMQVIAKMLPFSYVSWAPAKLVVAFDWAFFWQAVPVQAAYLVLAIGLAEGMYRMGVRGIQANGG